MISSIDCPALYKLWGGEIYLGSKCIDFTSVIIMIVLMQGSCHHQSILAQSAGSGARSPSCLFIMSDPGALFHSLFLFIDSTRDVFEKSADCRTKCYDGREGREDVSIYIQWISFHCQRTVKGIGFEKTAKYESGVPHPHLRDLTRNCCSPGQDTRSPHFRFPILAKDKLHNIETKKFRPSRLSRSPLLPVYYEEIWPLRSKSMVQII